MSLQLFISYAHEDKSYVSHLKRLLERNHLVWTDTDILGGASWWTTICEKIEECDCVIVLMSRHSIESIFCTAEIKYARELNKNILPLKFDNCIGLEILSEIQHIPLDGKTASALERACEASLGAILENKQRSKNIPIVTKSHHPPTPDSSEPARQMFIKASEMVDENNISLDKLLRVEEMLEQVLKGDSQEWRERAANLLRTVRDQIAELRLYPDRFMLYMEIAKHLDDPNQEEIAQEKWQRYIGVYGGDYDPYNLASRLDYSPSPPRNLPVKSLSNLDVILDWCQIPAGKVTIEYGDWKQGKDYEYEDYTTTHQETFDVSSFQITRYPITNAQFQVFMDDTNGYRNEAWWSFSPYALSWYQSKKPLPEPAFPGDNFPRTNVTWFEAMAFCYWLMTTLGNTNQVTLPTEQQWQRAAQGDANLMYPWGNQFDKDRCNTYASGIKKPTPVTRYPNSQSPFGVMDLIGNVWEWCLTEYVNGSNSNLENANWRVLHGASWASKEAYARSASRNWYAPDTIEDRRGFRVVQIS